MRRDFFRCGDRAREEKEIEAQARFVQAILWGEYDRGCLTRGADRIEELFARGNAGDRLYGERMEAYDRLSERLHPGEEEDEDIEVFFRNALALSEHIGLEMYKYGHAYALHPEDFPQIELIV